MNKTYIVIMALVFAVSAIALYLTIGNTEAPEMATDTSQTVDTSNFGTYPYTCDNGASFTMSPAMDMSTVKLDMVVGAPFGTVTLAKASATSGVRYEGGDALVFEAKGETVTMTAAGTQLTCKPVANPDEAPFNFGD